MMQTSQRPRLVYEVQPVSDEWILAEDKVPESRPHDLVSERVRALLAYWAQRTGRRAVVCRNLAVRWDEQTPAVGVDPDVCVIEPPPPEGDELTSLRLWDTGHHPPLLAVEIVSASRADKDYVQSPAKYAANGTQELWVFDPKLAGPKALGGSYRLQVWRREDNGDFRRLYAGEGPVWSEAVKGWLFAVEEGQSLRIADDEAGTSWWMTAEEAERAAKEAERAAKEEAQRSNALMAAKLRELGIDPDTLE
jgi:Uma2 family endonuclease